MIQAILKYQKKDEELRKIEQEISNSEERKKTVTAKKFLEGTNDSVDKLDLKATELICAYEKATKEKVVLQEQQDEIDRAIKDLTNENEANFLLKKAEELIAKIKALGSEATRIANEIQNVIKEYASVKSKINSAKAQFNEYAEKYQALKASKKPEMDKINKELLALKKDVNPSIMEMYEKKRADKIFPIFFEVANDACGACSMNLSMNEIAKLKSGEILECDHCRRLLYKL